MDRRTFLRTSAFLTAGAPAVADAADRAPAAAADPPGWPLPNLIPMSPEQADEATNRFFTLLERCRQSALAQVRDPKLPESQKANLYRLVGELRVYQAIDYLINDIGFIDRTGPWPKLSALPLGVGGYTARTALSCLGLTAFRAVVDVLSDRNRQGPFVAANLDAYAWVLWSIEGKRNALARLEDARARETSAQAQSQLGLVLKALRSYNDDPE